MTTNQSKYYDGSDLLSKMDINGNKPEIYLATGNRSSGKTTYFSARAVRRFKKLHEKFILTYRFSKELKDVDDKFFKEISFLFFQHDLFKAVNRADGVYQELLLNDISCGYAIAINAADDIKKLSHLMSDGNAQLFDEFQSETNKYCPNEITKFQSVHLSLARGGGKQVKYLPVYMISNTVTLLNPYYRAMGISTRLQEDTKFLRGNGFVLEQSFYHGVATQQQQSGFNQAFATSDYQLYANQNVYLNDNFTFVEQIKGKSRYIATIRYKHKDYAIYEYPELGLMYCSDKADISFPTRICITTEDMRPNYVMLQKFDMLIGAMRYFFDHGIFRFKNLDCKEAVFALLSY